MAPPLSGTSLIWARIRPDRAPEVAEAFATEQRDLAAACNPSGVAEPRLPAAGRELLDVDGQPTTLAQNLGPSPPSSCSTTAPDAPTATSPCPYQAQRVSALAERGIGGFQEEDQEASGRLHTVDATVPRGVVGTTPDVDSRRGTAGAQISGTRRLYEDTDGHRAAAI